MLDRFSWASSAFAHTINEIGAERFDAEPPRRFSAYSCRSTKGHFPPEAVFGGKSAKKPQTRDAGLAGDATGGFPAD
jgi:hypothetical protein